MLQENTALKSLLMEEQMETIEPVNRIGGLIPENKITLLHGLPGTGKTYSLIKFLNKHNIEPIYFNLDYTSIGSLKTKMFDEEVLKEFLLKKYDSLNGEVVIIDTYIRMEDVLDKALEGTVHQLPKKEKELRISNYLEKLQSHYNCTFIIIGHPEDYVGRSSVFKDNQTLVRNSYEALYLEKIIPTKKGTTDKDISYILHIQKGRSYTGQRLIENWMRD